MGAGVALPVCCNVSSSKVSSWVPKPPGRHTKPLDSFMSISLRVKKYFIATTRSEPASGPSGPSSKGRRIVTPRLCSGPAPSVAAAMMPGPAPVTTIQPLSASRRASSRACS